MDGSHFFPILVRPEFLHSVLDAVNDFTTNLFFRGRRLNKLMIALQLAVQTAVKHVSLERVKTADNKLTPEHQPG